MWRPCSLLTADSRGLYDLSRPWDPCALLLSDGPQAPRPGPLFHSLSHLPIFPRLGLWKLWGLVKLKVHENRDPLDLAGAAAGTLPVAEPVGLGEGTLGPPKGGSAGPAGPVLLSAQAPFCCLYCELLCAQDVGAMPPLRYFQPWALGGPQRPWEATHHGLTAHPRSSVNLASPCLFYEVQTHVSRGPGTSLTPALWKNELPVSISLIAKPISFSVVF